MPAWLPIVQVLMPHVAQIVAAAAPAFTARPGMVAEQIAELQNAARSSAEAVKLLAEQGQQMTKALEELHAAAEEAQKQLRLARRLAFAAIAVAILALVLAIVLLATR